MADESLNLGKILSPEYNFYARRTFVQGITQKWIQNIDSWFLMKKNPIITSPCGLHWSGCCPSLNPTIALSLTEEC